MFTQQRAAAGKRPGCRGQLRHDARRGHFLPAQAGFGQIHDHAARRIVRVGRDVARGIDAAGGHSGHVKHVQRIGRSPGQGPLSDFLVQALLPLTAAGVGSVSAVLGQPAVLSHQLGQTPEYAVLIRADDDPFGVGGRVHVGRRDAGQNRAGGPADDAELLELRERRLHVYPHRLVQRHVNHLALRGAAGAIPRVQGQKRADECLRRSERVTERYPDPHRRTAGLAGEIPEAAHGFGNRTEAGTIAVWPCLAESADPHKNKLRIDRVQTLPADAPSFKRSGPEVLDQDVRRRRQPAENFLALAGPHIHRDRFLATGDD